MVTKFYLMEGWNRDKRKRRDGKSECCDTEKDRMRRKERESIWLDRERERVREATGAAGWYSTFTYTFSSGCLGHWTRKNSLVQLLSLSLPLPPLYPFSSTPLLRTQSTTNPPPSLSRSPLVLPTWKFKSLARWLQKQPSPVFFENIYWFCRIQSLTTWNRSYEGNYKSKLLIPWKAKLKIFGNFLR